MSTCDIAGCDTTTYARGWCRKHYARWQRHGDPTVTLTPHRGDADARFLAKTRRLPNGCLEWTGYVNPGGYGTFGSGGKRGAVVLAHRWAYKRWVGPIPEGGTVDHECHNRDRSCGGGPSCRHRRCVEPDHLRATATLAENVAGSSNAPQHRTHCPQGHPYDEENTYVDRKGKRNCRACHRKKERERQRRHAVLRTHCANGHRYTMETMTVGRDGRRVCLICARSQGRRGGTARGRRNRSH